MRVQAVSELQRDQAWVPAGGGGVDLSLLAACLCPSEQVQEEPDEVWEPDQLLAALKSELLGDCGAAAAAGDWGPAADEDVWNVHGGHCP